MTDSLSEFPVCVDPNVLLDQPSNARVIAMGDFGAFMRAQMERDPELKARIERMRRGER